MGNTGTLFGWAFGDPAREQEDAYVGNLQDEALANARETAKAKGVSVVADSQVFTVLSADDSLVELDNAPGKLVVRCTVHVEGPGAEKLRAEGPMNG
ncbi:hypothetical protein ACIQF8_10500 [Pseudarthrobacter sp. NPDC092184]|jgi:hypothetical protein|uniref:Uncharacterized protein n=1 Tax=Pseudarthrobacter oxydans TaxID=1671 RepID=A0AAW8N684_PSEOX|nr:MULTISPECIES: hypothetical protein [Micrococcaceae]MDV2976981.1 hypothetical protein [Actinomycetes bacterium ARC8]MCD5343021.1 hypothetical protein [Arthrobacter sp. AK04]MDR6791070.1 hypothetical protein [Pseudarthrobacter oxydans]MDR7162501.1 hypothetical protein [Pseudarthrobacter oxydans]NSX37897.1 hypothetical protein [Pseudarthrobacter oxydans]